MRISKPLFIPQPLFAVPSLKLISKAFIFAELLDIGSTLFAQLAFPQMMEANPLPYLLGGWSQVLLVKIAATMIVVCALERRDLSRLAWVIPGIAIAPVLWNVLVMFVEAIVAG